MTINKSSLILPSEINEFSRRQFISRGVSLAGYLSTAALMAKLGLNTGTVYTQSSTKILRKLVWINMSGGWDLLETTDPKVNSNAKLDVMYGFEAAHALAGGDSNTKIGRWLSGIAAHGEDVVVVRGLAFARAEFATELGGDYTQGVSVQGYLAKQKFTGETQIYRQGRENDRIRSALNKFYSFSHKYPAFYISLPGDFEIYTVSPQALDLTYPLFVGLHVEPFLALNQFEIADWITWKEKNFGVKLGLATGYEAFKTGDTKRLAFRVGAGGAFSTHEGSGSSRGRIVEVELKPTPRKRLEYYLDLGLVYHAI